MAHGDKDGDGTLDLVEFIRAFKTLFHVKQTNDSTDLKARSVGPDTLVRLGPRLSRLMGKAFATRREAEPAVWSRLSALNGGRELRHQPAADQVTLDKEMMLFFGLHDDASVAKNENGTTQDEEGCAEFQVSLWIIKETLASRVDVNCSPIYSSKIQESSASSSTNLPDTMLQLHGEEKGVLSNHTVQSHSAMQNSQISRSTVSASSDLVERAATGREQGPATPRGAFLASVKAQKLMPLPLPLTTIYNQPSLAVDVADAIAETNAAVEAVEKFIVTKSLGGKSLQKHKEMTTAVVHSFKKLQVSPSNWVDMLRGFWARDLEVYTQNALRQYKEDVADGKVPEQSTEVASTAASKWSSDQSMRVGHSVRLAGCPLGEGYTCALAAAVAALPSISLTAADFSGNGMDDASIRLLVAALAGKHALTYIDLSGNKLGPKTRAAEVDFLSVFEQLLAPPAPRMTLATLHLSKNRIGDTGVKLLVDAMLSGTSWSKEEGARHYPNKTLRTLGLADNSITDRGAYAIAQLVSMNSTVTELDLHWNNIRSRGGLAISRGLRSNIENSALLELNLANNALGEEGCAGFGRSIGALPPTGGKLRTLDLSQNHCGPAGAIALAIGLANNSTIRSLILDYNDVGLEGARALMGAVRDAEARTGRPGAACAVRLHGCVFKSQADSAKLLFNPNNPDGTYELNMQAAYDAMVVKQLHRLGCATPHAAWTRVSLDGRKIVQCRGCGLVQRVGSVCTSRSTLSERKTSMSEDEVGEQKGCGLAMRAAAAEGGKEGQLLNKFPADLSDFPPPTVGILRLTFVAKRPQLQGMPAEKDAFEGLLSSLAGEIGVVARLAESALADAAEEESLQFGQQDPGAAVAAVAHGLPSRFVQLVAASTHGMSFSVQQIGDLMKLATTTGGDSQSVTGLSAAGATLATLFTQIVEHTGLEQLLVTLDESERDRLQQRLGQLYWWDPANFTGRYRINLGAEGAADLKLLHLLLDKAEREKQMRQRRRADLRLDGPTPDLSQRGDDAIFRNISIDGTLLTGQLTPARLPSQGLLQFDITSTFIADGFRDEARLKKLCLASDQDLQVLILIIEGFLKQATVLDGRTYSDVEKWSAVFISGPLRAACRGLFFSFDQVKQLVSSILSSNNPGTMTAFRKQNSAAITRVAVAAELIITLFGRTLDVARFQSPGFLLNALLCPPDTLCPALCNRLGWKLLFAPESAAGRYQLRLDVLDEHNVAEMLISLAVNETCEKGSGGSGSAYFRYLALDGIEQLVPEIWTSELPWKGVLVLEYTSDDSVVCAEARAAISNFCWSGELSYATAVQREQQISSGASRWSTVAVATIRSAQRAAAAPTKGQLVRRLNALNCAAAMANASRSGIPASSDSEFSEGRVARCKQATVIKQLMVPAVSTRESIAAKREKLLKRTFGI
eukprot:SAG31_NODE_247_length_19134_cov_12.255050_15_plen_1421_part_00